MHITATSCDDFLRALVRALTSPSLRKLSHHLFFLPAFSNIYHSLKLSCFLSAGHTIVIHQ